MKIDVILSPAEIDLLPQKDLRDTVCVVFDILRATSSIVTALEHGAQEVYPARSIEEAFSLRSKFPGALLGGERHGDKIEGFDLGNSPAEYAGDMPRRIITTTTNGTIALRACEGAARVFAGALLNMKALAAALSSEALLLLVCAGTFRDSALEDVFAAGMLCEALRGADLTDAAGIATSVFKRYRGDGLAALTASRNGHVLKAHGRAEDIAWCARVSVYEAMGEMLAGIVRPIRAENG